MLAAQLKGKLTRKEENKEDLLTSNVFGSIKYVPYEEGLIPLLSSVEDIDGKNPINLSQISNVKYDFWPQLNEENCKRCEPDVLIYITYTTGTQAIILVEAKYKSGKSSEADDEDMLNDQLSREWDNLLVLSRRKDAMPIFVYITADLAFPNKDLEDAQFEIEKKSKNEMDIVWISWRKLSVVLGKSQYEIIKDLVSVLQKQWLIFFEGISATEHFEPIKWRFQCTPLNINWLLNVPKMQWKYNYNDLIRFDFYSINEINVMWRYINE